MILSEASDLLARCATFDNRQPSLVASKAWANALHDVPLDDDTFAAVDRFYGTPPEKAGERLWIQPHDVRRHRKIIRAERVANFVYDPPPGDELGASYADRYRRQLDDVASGRRPGSGQAPALSGGPHPAVARRLAGIGRVVPGEDPAVAEVKRPGPLGRRCPTCSAAVGRPCRTPRGRERAPHPARRPEAPAVDREAQEREAERRREASRRYLAVVRDDEQQGGEAS